MPRRLVLAILTVLCPMGSVLSAVSAQDAQTSGTAQAPAPPRNQRYVIPPSATGNTSAAPGQKKPPANPSKYVIPAGPVQPQPHSMQPAPSPRPKQGASAHHAAPASPTHGQLPSAAPQHAVKPAVQGKRAAAVKSAPTPKPTLEAAPIVSKEEPDAVFTGATAKAVIWEDPVNIAARNLFFGQGGELNQPHAPFALVKDNSSRNLALNVTDVAGTVWRVNVGDETRPEVVASRLLWSIGYLVNDDYLVNQPGISGVIGNHGEIKNARFSRAPENGKRVGIWRWKSNPLVNTREFNGLRVMMAVINGWNPSDESNAVYKDEKTGRQLYVAGDISATYGTNGISRTSRTKEDVNGPKFITKATESSVSFATPAKPGYEWMGRDIPRQDARWVGTMLAQLSHAQLEDAFRAGGFSADDIDEYVALIESRIDELKTL